MTLRKFAGIAIRVLVIPVTLITILIGVLSYADVSLPLERMRKAFVTTASELTGREVRIDGEVRLAISFFPTLVVDQLHIANEAGWEADDIISVEEVRVQIALMPILSGKLEFKEIAAERVLVNLEQDADGRKNWSLAKAENEQVTDAAFDVDTEPKKQRTGEQITIDEFSLTDVTINYHDEKLGRGFTDRIDRLQINTHDRSRLTASLSGTTEDTAYSFTASSDLMRNLVKNAPWRLNAQGQVGGHPVTLAANIDTSHGVVDGQIEMIAQDVHGGKILDWLGITKELDLFSKGLRIKADLNGGSLHDIVHQSNFSVELTNGYMNLHSHVDNKFKTARFENATIEANNSQDLKVAFNGKIDQEPVEFVFRSNPLGAFFKGIDKVKLELAAKLARAELKLHGDVMLPVSSRTFSIDMSVNGEHLGQWNSLIASQLPPLGPYSLTGRFDMKPKGFHISNLKAVVGHSDLGGTIDIDITKERPLWNMRLVSEEFQIDDFDVEGFSLIPGEGDKEMASDTSARQKTIEMMEKADKSLDKPHYSDHLDADITLEAKHVLSGKDILGHGEMVMKARESKLDIEEFHLNVPGGKIDGAMNLELVSDGITGRIKLDMDKLDYGILVRRINPDSIADGLVSTRIDLQLAGKDFSHSFDKAAGKFDFVAWPKHISADALNIWSVNLFFAILPSLSKKEAKFNCVVAILDTKEGQLNESFLGIDTTKVWLNGNLKVNFPNETVNLRLFPHSKTAKIFGLQTPIQVKGSFDELSLSVRPIDIIGSYVSFILSPLHAPMRRIFGKNIPEDGSEICGKLLDRDYLQSIKDQIQEREDSLDNAYSGD